MGLTYIAATKASWWDVEDVLTAESTLNVAAGDLLVAVIGWRSNAQTFTSLEEAEGGNDFTIGTTYNYGTSYYLTFAWVLAATADAAASFVLTLAGTVNQPRLAILQFRPDSGDTVTLDDGPAVNTGSDASGHSGDIDTSGDDCVAIAAHGQHYQPALTGEEIEGVAADGTYNCDNSVHVWYKTYTSTQSAIASSCTHDWGDWVQGMVAFKSAAAGGGVNTKIVSYYMARRRK
jgi:hypothetical protein